MSKRQLRWMPPWWNKVAVTPATLKARAGKKKIKNLLDKQGAPILSPFAPSLPPSLPVKPHSGVPPSINVCAFKPPPPPLCTPPYTPPPMLRTAPHPPPPLSTAPLIHVAAGAGCAPKASPLKKHSGPTPYFTFHSPEKMGITV